ncbi:MAG TPA: chloride channel protein [Thermoanaerobaculia bacterium]|nr:chloride channel protein [Thermoanaerobaculia bacterium]
MHFLPRLRSLARRFLLLTLVVIGAICGVLAVLFHQYVELARRLLLGRALETHGALRVALFLGIPSLTFAGLALIIRRLAPGAVGANLARVRMAYNADPSLLGTRAIAATFLATPLSLGAGAPLGPEGPIVVVTSGVSAAIARWLRLPRKLVRGMIPVGVAAGIAAVFNTPITAVVFALEEVFGAADRGLLGGVLVGAVAAAVVEKALLGGRPLLAASASVWSNWRELLGFAIVGLLCGGISGYAIRVIHVLRRWCARIMPSTVMRVSLAGLLIGAIGLAVPSILGVGYDSVSFWLHGGDNGATTGIAFVAKVIAFTIAISAGVLGGTFAPSLFMGAALGAAIGDTARQLFPTAAIDPKAYALVGMGAFFAGLLRSPIAAVLIAVELTSDYDLIVPLMLAVSLSVAVSRVISRHSMVEQQMLDEGWIEGHDAADPLAAVSVAEAMTREPVALRAEVAVGEALASARHRVYPVIDDGGRLMGVVLRAALERSDAAQPIGELVEQPKLVADAGERLIEVVRRMQMRGADRCVVVDETRRVVGFLSPADILRARLARTTADEERFELFG